MKNEQRRAIHDTDGIHIGEYHSKECTWCGAALTTDMKRVKVREQVYQYYEPDPNTPQHNNTEIEKIVADHAYEVMELHDDISQEDYEAGVRVAEYEKRAAKIHHNYTQSIEALIIQEMETLKDEMKEYVRTTPGVHADELPFWVAGRIAARKLQKEL